MAGSKDPALQSRGRLAGAAAKRIGGMARKNFVPIVEHAGDAARVQNLWQPRPQTDFFQRPTKKKAAAAIGSEGIIETFTILHITPDGFLPPLALALIRDRKGSLVMAQGEDIINLKIGREVFLRQVAGTYYFTVKSQLHKVSQAIRQLFRKTRPPAKPAVGAGKKVDHG